MMLWPAGYVDPQPAPRPDLTDADIGQALATFNSMREKTKQQAKEYRRLESGLRASRAEAAAWRKRCSRKEAEGRSAARVVKAAEKVVAAFGNVLEIGQVLAKLKEALEAEV